MTSTFDYYDYLVNIIIIVAFLGALYLGGKLLTQKGLKKVSGRKMEIIERIPLGTDRYLLMFKVKDKIYIVMVHRNGSELIDAIPADSFDDEVENVSRENSQFAEILSKFSELKKNK
ncbi:MAG: flagellar biosynthetic protein FliO [Clostridia bacterium]|nr:flagellar biosynthetic protein FliO [Clostridia bacterium]